MPYLNWFDPRFQIDMLLGFLDEIDQIESDKVSAITEQYDEWISENKLLKTENPDYFDWKEESFNDDIFIASELKRTILNGIAITLNTVLERHICFILGKYYDKRQVSLEPRYTYKASDLKKELKKIEHLNIEQLSDALVQRIDIYQEIRNIIVHKEGLYGDYSNHVKQFIERNSDLFETDSRNEKIDVLRTYIEKVSTDINLFFNLILYTDKGMPIEIT